MLKVKFIQIKNVVCMEVLEQSKEDTDFLKKSVFIGSNGLKLHSCAYPEVDYDGIYVRGDKTSKDKKISCYSFENEELSKKFIKEINQTIREFNNRNLSPENQEQKIDYEVTISF